MSSKKCTGLWVNTVLTENYVRIKVIHTSRWLPRWIFFHLLQFFGREKYLNAVVKLWKWRHCASYVSVTKIAIALTLNGRVPLFSNSRTMILFISQCDFYTTFNTAIWWKKCQFQVLHKSACFCMESESTSVEFYSGSISSAFYIYKHPRLRIAYANAIWGLGQRFSRSVAVHRNACAVRCVKLY